MSPFNWLIIVSDGQQHHTALVNLAYTEESTGPVDKLGWLGKLWAAYLPSDRLKWKSHSLYGELEVLRPTAKEVWQQPQFAEFRRFAEFPVLYRLDRSGQQTCVWYTDLRYVLLSLTPRFRYGMCRNSSTKSWLLYRLRRFYR